MHLVTHKVKLNEKQETGNNTATSYDATIRQLQINSLGLEGQIKKMTEATDKDTEANKNNTKSLVQRINTVRQLLSGMSSGITLAQNIIQQTKDWNAVNEDSLL